MENIPTLLKSRDQHLLGPSLSPKFKQDRKCEVIKRGRGTKNSQLQARGVVLYTCTKIVDKHHSVNPTNIDVYVIVKHEHRPTKL